MIRFVSHEPIEFSDFSSMAYHEAAHALLAFYHGFRLGSFIVIRLKDNRVGAKFQSAPNEMWESADEKTVLTKKAQKWLAGEIASRKFLELPIEEIGLFVHNAETYSRKSRLNGLVEAVAQNDTNSDAFKVLQAALQLELENWWEWVEGCHSSAVKVVEDQWPSIKELATLFEPEFFVAKKGEVTGENVLKCLMNSGAVFSEKEWGPGLM